VPGGLACEGWGRRDSLKSMQERIVRRIEKDERAPRAVLRPPAPSGQDHETIFTAEVMKIARAIHAGGPTGSCPPSRQKLTREWGQKRGQVSSRRRKPRSSRCVQRGGLPTNERRSDDHGRSHTRRDRQREFSRRSPLMRLGRMGTTPSYREARIDVHQAPPRGRSDVTLPLHWPQRIGRALVHGSGSSIRGPRDQLMIEPSLKSREELGPACSKSSFARKYSRMLPMSRTGAPAP